MKGKGAILAIVIVPIVILIAIIYSVFHYIFSIMNWLDGGGGNAPTTISYSKGMTNAEIQQMAQTMTQLRANVNQNATNKGQNYTTYSGGASGGSISYYSPIPTLGTAVPTIPNNQSKGKVKLITKQEAVALSNQYQVPLQRLNQYIPYINEYGSQWGVPPKLIVAQMYQESQIGNPNYMISNQGAYGVMQELVSTSQGLSIELGLNQKITSQLLLQDFALNIELGVFYDYKNIESCSGDLTCALQSYNEGFGAWSHGNHYSQAVIYAQDILSHYGGTPIISYPSSSTIGQNQSPIVQDPWIQLSLMAQTDYYIVNSFNQKQLNQIQTLHESDINKNQLIGTYQDALRIKTQKQGWNIQDWMMNIRKDAMSCYLYGDQCSNVSNLVPTQERGVLLQVQATNIHTYTCTPPPPPPPSNTLSNAISNVISIHKTGEEIKNRPIIQLLSQSRTIHPQIQLISDVYQNPVIQEYPQGKIPHCPAKYTVNWHTKTTTAVKYSNVYDVLLNYGLQNISLQSSNNYVSWINYYYQQLVQSSFQASSGSSSGSGVGIALNQGLPVVPGTAGQIIKTAEQWAPKTIYISGGGRSPGGVLANQIGSGNLNQDLTSLGQLQADCSSFVWWMFRLNGVIINPNIPLSSVYTGTEVNAGIPISPTTPSQWKPGDLIFFYIPQDSPANDGHVVIYMGNGIAIGDQSPQNGAYAFKISAFLNAVPGSYVENVRQILGTQGG